MWKCCINYFKILWVGFSKKYGDKCCRNFEICLFSFLFMFFDCRVLLSDFEVLLNSELLKVENVGLIIFNFFRLFNLIENIVLLLILVVFFDLKSKDVFLFVLVVVVEGKLFGIWSCFSCFVKDDILDFLCVGWKVWL